MKELEVALAVAISFLMFSSLVSMAVEVLFRSLKQRSKGLKLMLNDYYSHEIAPHIGKWSNTQVLNENETTERAAKFANDLLKKSEQGHLLSTRQFILRFAETEYGKQLAKKSRAEIEVLVRNATELYDDYSQVATEKFRRKSEIWNTAVALVFAFAFNVNVITLISTFISNEAMTQAVIANSAKVQAQYQLQSEQLSEQLSQDDEELKGLRDSINKLNDSLEEAKALNLPIGWTQDPLKDFDELTKKWLCEENQSIEQCQQKHPSTYEISKKGLWILSTLITGVLIGLGGPFWFDMIKKITAVRQVAGALSNKLVANSASPEQENVQQQEDPVALFDQAIKAQQLLSSSNSSLSGAAQSLTSVRIRL